MVDAKAGRVELLEQWSCPAMLVEVEKYFWGTNNFQSEALVVILEDLIQQYIQQWDYIAGTFGLFTRIR